MQKIYSLYNLQLMLSTFLPFYLSTSSPDIFLFVIKTRFYPLVKHETKMTSWILCVLVTTVTETHCKSLSGISFHFYVPCPLFVQQQPCQDCQIRSGCNVEQKVPRVEQKFHLSHFVETKYHVT